MSGVVSGIVGASALLSFLRAVPAGETLLSPLVMCGPHGTQFLKPVELRLPHCASMTPDGWSFALKSSDTPTGTYSPLRTARCDAVQNNNNNRMQTRARRVQVVQSRANSPAEPDNSGVTWSIPTGRRTPVGYFPLKECFSLCFLQEA